MAIMASFWHKTKGSFIFYTNSQGAKNNFLTFQEGERKRQDPDPKILGWIRIRRSEAGSGSSFPRVLWKILNA